MEALLALTTVLLLVLLWALLEAVREEDPWATLERYPGFNERLERGRSELQRGKRVEFLDDDDAWGPR